MKISWPSLAGIYQTVSNLLDFQTRRYVNRPKIYGIPQYNIRTVVYLYERVF